MNQNLEARIVVKTDSEFKKKIKMYCIENNITISSLVLTLLEEFFKDDEEQKKSKK